MDPNVERRCLALVASSMALLTVGIGYFVVFETTIADFIVILAGLVLGWTAFLYCLGVGTYWGE